MVTLREYLADIKDALAEERKKMSVLSDGVASCAWMWKVLAEDLAEAVGAVVGSKQKIS